MTKFFGLAAALLMTVSLLTTVGCESTRTAGHDDRGAHDALVVVDDGTLYRVQGGRNKQVFAYQSAPTASYCEACATDAKTYALTGELVETCVVCGKKRHAANPIGGRGR